MAEPNSITLSPAFKLVFIGCVALTLISLGLAVYLGSERQPTDAIKHLTESCEDAYKIGFGAIVGLLGGKAA